MSKTWIAIERAKMPGKIKTTQWGKLFQLLIVAIEKRMLDHPYGLK